MIGFIACSKAFGPVTAFKTILDNVTQVFDPRDKIGILADAGTGKSTIIRLLCGIERPDTGSVLRGEGLTWPIGFGGLFHPALTAEENIRIAAVMVGCDADAISVYCKTFAELGEDYYQPLTTYSGTMRGRLAFAFSMAIPATTYVSEEIVGAGNAQFRNKCEAALMQRLVRTGLILFTRNPRTSERLCEHHGVLRNGRITMLASHADAVSAFEADATVHGVIDDLVTAFETS